MFGINFSVIKVNEKLILNFTFENSPALNSVTHIKHSWYEYNNVAVIEIINLFVDNLKNKLLFKNFTKVPKMDVRVNKI